jgi:hypothetical protein
MDPDGFICVADAEPSCVQFSPLELIRYVLMADRFLKELLNGPIRDILEAQERYRRMFEPAFLEQLKEHINLVSGRSILGDHLRVLAETEKATKQMLGLADHAAMFRSISQSVVVHPEWMAELDRHREVANSITSLADLYSGHLAEIVAVTQTARASFADIEWDNIRRVLGRQSYMETLLRDPLEELFESHRNLWEGIESPELVLEVAPAISRCPPRELYRQARVVERLSVKPESIDEGDTAVESYLEDSAYDQLGIREQLASLDPGFLRIWAGATHACESDNPDKARHVVSSLRELVTHVLHRLAPDEAVKAWVTDETLISDNRPTRRARYLFICREMSLEPLSNFVALDARTAIELIDLLNKGTHKIESNLDTPQLHALMSRVAGLLVFLISIHRSGR